MDSTVDTITGLCADLDFASRIGRAQTFAILARRCHAAFVESLLEFKDSKRYSTLGHNWESFCESHLGISRATADRILRQYQLSGGSPTIADFVRLTKTDYATSIALLDPAPSTSTAEAAAQTLRDAVGGLSRIGATPLDEDELLRLLISVDDAIAALTRLRDSVAAETKP